MLQTQMQTAGFDKCKTAKPANPDICSAQIEMHDFDKCTRARHTDVIFETWHMHMLEPSVIQIITHIEKMIRHNHYDVKIRSMCFSFFFSYKSLQVNSCKTMAEYFSHSLIPL